MNMQNIPDKDLDKIFTQAAENYQAPFDAGAWQKMQHKLDKTVMSKNFWRRYLLLIIGLLIVPLLLLVTNNMFWHKQAPQIQNNNPKKVLVLDQPAENAASVTGKADREYSLEEKNNQIASSTDATNTESFGIPATPVRAESIAVIRKVSGRQNQIFASQENGSNIIQMPEMKQALVPQFHTELKSGDRTILVTEKAVAVIPAENKFSPYFSLAVSLSPDLSGLGFRTFSKPGASMGVFLQYHFSERFSVVTGISQAWKIYSLTDGFKPYEGYWQKYSKPDLIDGQCTVLDIPINFRYDIITTDQHRVFFSAGLSSYFMLTEDYQYFYYDDPQYNRGYSVDNENRHLFGIVNISAGFEHHFNKHWSVQLEPVIKLPAAKVGVGNLPLMSAGAFLALKYHFIRPNSP